MAALQLLIICLVVTIANGQSSRISSEEGETDFSTQELLNSEVSENAEQREYLSSQSGSAELGPQRAPAMDFFSGRSARLRSRQSRRENSNRELRSRGLFRRRDRDNGNTAKISANLRGAGSPLADLETAEANVERRPTTRKASNRQIGPQWPTSGGIGSSKRGRRRKAGSREQTAQQVSRGDRRIFWRPEEEIERLQVTRPSRLTRPPPSTQPPALTVSPEPTKERGLWDGRSRYRPPTEQQTQETNRFNGQQGNWAQEFTRYEPRTTTTPTTTTTRLPPGRTTTERGKWEGLPVVIPKRLPQGGMPIPGKKGIMAGVSFQRKGENIGQAVLPQPKPSIIGTTYESSEYQPALTIRRPQQERTRRRQPRRRPKQSSYRRRQEESEESEERQPTRRPSAYMRSREHLNKLGVTDLLGGGIPVAPVIPSVLPSVGGLGSTGGLLGGLTKSISTIGSRITQGLGTFQKGLGALGNLDQTPNNQPQHLGLSSTAQRPRPPPPLPRSSEQYYFSGESDFSSESGQEMIIGIG